MLDVLVHDTKNAMMRLSGQIALISAQVKRLDEGSEIRTALEGLIVRATTESRNVCDLMKRVTGSVYGGELSAIVHRPIGICELVGQRLEPAFARFKKCQNLDIRLTPANHVLDAHVICSPDAFARVVENLLDNATKAQATRIAVDLVETDCSVEITFRDNGVGMNERQITELGFRHGTSGQVGRTGRGFAFARRLVADAGGVLERPRSIPGFATEVKIVLKKYVPQRPEEAVEAPSRESDEVVVFELA